MFTVNILMLKTRVEVPPNEFVYLAMFHEAEKGFLGFKLYLGYLKPLLSYSHGYVLANFGKIVYVHLPNTIYRLICHRQITSHTIFSLSVLSTARRHRFSCL